MTVSVPPHLAAADGSPAFAAWRATLPATVATYAARWDLRVGEPFAPGGQTAWVAPARTATDELVVLKLGWRHPEGDAEAAGLRAWGGRGAVRVHADHVDGETNGLLLELCHPGRPLSLAAEPEQDRVLARLLRRLWSAPADSASFRPLQSMCDLWADGVSARVAAADRDQSAIVDPGLARAGAELLRALPGTAPRAVLLATDLHAGNVLAARREPWLMIDPKPYLGDPAYDVLQHMLNCDRLRRDPRGLSRRLAEMLELDAKRLEQWLFARCAIEAVTDPELAGVARMLSPL